MIHDAIRQTTHPSRPEAAWDIPPSFVVVPMTVLCIIDVPLSLVADTVCLPYDLWAKNAKSEEPAQETGKPVLGR